MIKIKNNNTLAYKNLAYSGLHIKRGICGTDIHRLFHVSTSGWSIWSHMCEGCYVAPALAWSKIYMFPSTPHNINTINTHNLKRSEYCTYIQATKQWPVKKINWHRTSPFTFQKHRNARRNIFTPSLFHMLISYIICVFIAGNVGPPLGAKHLKRDWIYRLTSPAALRREDSNSVHILQVLQGCAGVYIHAQYQQL